VRIGAETGDKGCWPEKAKGEYIDCMQILKLNSTINGRKLKKKINRLVLLTPTNKVNVIITVA
jgi:hypothetical protein